MAATLPTSFLLIMALFSCLYPMPSHSSDPDPLQDFCVADLTASPSVNGFPCKAASAVTAHDFSSAALSGKGNTSNAFGSKVTAANVLAFPALNTLGVSMNRVDLAEGGLNPPHTHPRASELDIVLKGKVLIGFITTGNVYYSKVLTRGELFVIPRGLVHFQRNVGKGDALIITSFNSQLPGAAVLPTTLFSAKPSIPDGVLSQAFQVEESVVDDIKAKFGS
ncbi:hypothetical protein Nepgr_003159 [Nepenthes gracilis]|uniref:Germin-like protein n=1 Tax=Nepenthes gracilis TaxID=150966 RepID=A0AAD3XDD9_NEPGR|nr:hypothetical protein Nepgr_003159 [Nepenthes gracilis]